MGVEFCDSLKIYLFSENTFILPYHFIVNIAVYLILGWK